MTTERLYTLREAARRIGVSQAWLVDLLDAGEAVAVTVQTGRGSERRFTAAEIERQRRVRTDALLEALGREWDAEHYLPVIALPAAPSLPSSVSTGWAHIVSDLLTAIALVAPDFRVHTISEKFGGLRVIMDVHSVPREVVPEVMRLKREATQRSLVTCDVCGGAGSIIELGWCRTRCAKDRAAEAVESVLWWPEAE